jgi:hypothetical protein
VSNLLKIICALAFLPLIACEKAADITLPPGEAQLVVEGYIEPGLPPIVLLTESQPIFSPLNATTLAAAQIHGARITVSTAGDTTVTLREIVADSLPIALRQALAQQAGLTLDPVTGRFPIPISFYTAFPEPGKPYLVGRAARTYVLRVEARGRIATAITSIPTPVALDSLYFRAPNNPQLRDSLVQLYYRFRDPDTIGNATRYFTSVNGGPFLPPRLASVFTDEFVNGRTVDFALDRGRLRSDTISGLRAALFRRGDTIRVRWCMIDQPHFRFWLSYDNALNINGSPLASPSTLASNVRGGLGIWGGYGATVKTVVAPK